MTIPWLGAGEGEALFTRSKQYWFELKSWYKYSGGEEDVKAVCYEVNVFPPQ
jgi:hypothetical protein